MIGYFITFEGPDGAGKSTQIHLLNDYLKSKGWDTVVTREPGGTPIGEKIRSIILDVENRDMNPITEMFLYAAARAQHVSQVIKPALKQGKIVLCDRFVDSSIAYQGFGRELGVEMVEKVNRFALQGITPDITLLFDINPEKGLERSAMRHRGVDRLEEEKLDFHRRVYEGYVLLSRKYPERFHVIDASRKIEEIHKTIIGEIEQLLKRPKSDII
jgi:dTMP kinase